MIAIESHDPLRVIKTLSDASVRVVRLGRVSRSPSFTRQKHLPLPFLHRYRNEMQRLWQKKIRYLKKQHPWWNICPRISHVGFFSLVVKHRTDTVFGGEQHADRLYNLCRQNGTVSTSGARSASLRAIPQERAVTVRMYVCVYVKRHANCPPGRSGVAGVRPPSEANPPAPSPPQTTWARRGRAAWRRAAAAWCA